MKLTVIGGGGIRSLFLAKSLAQRAQRLGLDQIVLMDNDSEKLRIYGGMARQVALRLAPDLDVKLTTDPIEAVKAADYVLTTIRAGGDTMRVRDERIAMACGLLGQETTGAAGFSFAMRSIPVLARYCALIREYASPNVKVFNFTNPAGVVSQALRDLGYDFTYGICDAPTSMLSQIAKLYGVPSAALESVCYGLNHLSVFESIRLEGRELIPEIISNPRAYTETDLRIFGRELVEHLGCIPNEYLYYYFYREKAVANVCASLQTRGELIEEVNRAMTAELSDMDVERDFDKCMERFEYWYAKRINSYMAGETGISRKDAWRFDFHSPDEGGYAGVALRFIDIVQSGKEGRMILCVPNDGAIPGLRDDDVIESTCRITPGGCVPYAVEHPDERMLELIRRVKSYERLAARAICSQDKALAIDCLMLHPLVNSYSLASRLAQAYLELNASYIQSPQI